MATYRSVNPGDPGGDGDRPGDVRSPDRPDDVTTLIPRIAREYTPAPSLFPPWVSTAAIILVFAVFLALSCLFVLAIINILIAFSQEGLS